MVAKKSHVRRLEEIESEIIGPCHDFLEAEQAAKTANYTWESVDYKVYPSALKSLIFCPKKFFDEEVHKPMYFQLNALEAMEAGKAIHTMYGNIMKRIPGFIQRPDLSYYRTLYPEHYEVVKQKNQEADPEAYFWHPPSGVSGRADVTKRRLICDMKSMCVPDIAWDKEKKKFIGNLWEEEKLKLGDGLEKHKLQVAVYIYFWNLFKYSEEEIRWGNIAYINTAMKKGQGEFYETPKFYFTDQMKDIFDHLFQEVCPHHREAWIKDRRQVECIYSKCPEHRSNRVIS